MPDVCTLWYKGSVSRIRAAVPIHLRCHMLEAVLVLPLSDSVEHISMASKAVNTA